MSEVSPTFTVSMAQYEHMQDRIAQLETLAGQWQTQYEHAQERYEAQFHLNAELIQGVKRVQAEAWDGALREAHASGWLHDWALSDALARNPYREA